MTRKQKKKFKFQIVWEKRYLEASLSPKKEFFAWILFNVFFLGVVIILTFLNQNWLMSISCLIACLGTNVWFLGKPKRIKERKSKEDENEFVHLFSYFSIYVRNGEPVYQALEDTMHYASPRMADKFQTMLTAIDKDKSVQPYLDFAENFHHLEIQQVMMSIYKMSKEGEGEAYLRQFEMMFENLADEKRQERIEQERRHYSNFNFLPTTASALSVGMIAVAIVILMEQFNHVL